MSGAKNPPVAIWSPIGAVEIRPIHALHDACLLGAEARGAHGWTWDARHRLTELLLHTACDEAVLWRDLTGTAPLTVAVRLPAASCGARLVDQVAGALARTGLDAGLLELGLCRSAAAAAGPGELLAWSALRDMGLGVSLEIAPDMTAEAFLDRASRATLMRLPFTTLRLPPWVADQLEDRPAVRRLLREVVRLAAGHAASVVAAGVSCAAQRDILVDLGCDAAQGPLFGSPMHPAAFHAALAQDALI